MQDLCEADNQFWSILDGEGEFETEGCRNEKGREARRECVREALESGEDLEGDQDVGDAQKNPEPARLR